MAVGRGRAAQLSLVMDRALLEGNPHIRVLWGPHGGMFQDSWFGMANVFHIYETFFIFVSNLGSPLSTGEGFRGRKVLSTRHRGRFSRTKNYCQPGPGTLYSQYTSSLITHHYCL